MASGRTASVGFDLDGPRRQVAVADAETVGVMANYREAHVDGFRPTTVNDEHRPPLASARRHTASIDRAADDSRPHDHEIKRVDQGRYHRGGEVWRRSGDDGKAFKGHSMIDSGSQSQTSDPDERRPRALRQRVGQADEEQRWTGDLHHTPAPPTFARQEGAKIGPDRQGPLARQRHRCRARPQFLQRQDRTTGRHSSSGTHPARLPERLFAPTIERVRHYASRHLATNPRSQHHSSSLRQPAVR